MRKPYRYTKITHSQNGEPLSCCSLKCDFLLYMESKNQNRQKYWRKYRKVFENLLTKCEYGAILCTEKNENKTKIWLFFRLILQF